MSQMSTITKLAFAGVAVVAIGIAFLQGPQASKPTKFYCGVAPNFPGGPRECLSSAERCERAGGGCFERAKAYCCTRPSEIKGVMIAACGPTKDECQEFCDLNLPGRTACREARPDEIPDSGDLEPATM